MPQQITSLSLVDVGLVANVSFASGDQRGSTVIAVGPGDRSLIFYYDVASSSLQVKFAASFVSFTPTTVATNVAIATAGSGNEVPVSAARLANGNVAVTWAGNEANASIYFAIYDANMNVVVGPTVAEGTGLAGTRPDIAASATGFVIAWEKAITATNHDIVYRRFDANGVSNDFGGGVSAGLDTSTAFDEAPAVGVLADGGIVLAWDRLADGVTNVYQAVVNSDGSVRVAPRLVNNFTSPATSGVHREVDIAITRSGYTLYWEETASSSNPKIATAVRSYDPQGYSPSIGYRYHGDDNVQDLTTAVSSAGYTLTLATVGTAETNIAAYFNSQAIDVVTDPGNDRVASATWIDDSLTRITWDHGADGEIYTKLMRMIRTTDSNDSASIYRTSDNVWDVVNGNDLNNVFAGGGGNDVLYGAGGNDVLIGGAGDDQLFGGIGSNELYGGVGNDTYTVVAGDTIVEDADGGYDTVSTALSVYVLATNIEALVYTGADPFVGVGNAGNNTIQGGTGRDELYGGDGNDTLLDGGGTTGQEDTLFGGLGDDTYVITLKGDSTKESVGEGTDTVQTSLGIYALQANVENLTFTDNRSHDAGVGNELGNTIRGGTGADSIYARAGDDIIYGGKGAANTLLGQEGNDIYYVEARGDTVLEYANEGTDTVRASVDTFVLPNNVEHLAYVGTSTFTGIGNTLGNQINGGAGADFLSGLEGDDVIFGGSGADFLQGGAGHDGFAYLGGETGYDRINDFTAADDRMLLVSSGFAHTATLAFVSGAGAAATTASSTFLYDTNTGIVSYDADGNGAGTGVQLAQLNLGLTLSLANFGFV